ncbi:MAG: DNA polymerase I [Candidatus Dojkabacteria bacterium]
MSRKFLIIDSYALIFRAYYAYPTSLQNAAGQLTNAAYGFTSILMDVVKKFEPTHVIAVFDSEKPTIRSTEFVTYKANRKETDTELIEQIPIVREILEALDIPVLSVDGYEADDIIGTLVENKLPHEEEKIIVTGDQDLFQLIKHNTKIYLAGSTFSKSKLYERDEVYKKLQIWPEQVPDYKGLCGDPSDNIPGVKGIGKKGAASLLNEYKTLDKIYENIENIKGSTQKKLAENYEIAIKSRELATIIYNVPFSFNPETSVLNTIDVNKASAVLKKYEFRSLYKKLEELSKKYKTSESFSLFENSPKDFEQVSKTKPEYVKVSSIRDLSVQDENVLWLISKSGKEFVLADINKNVLALSSEAEVKNAAEFIIKNNILLNSVDIKDLLLILARLNIDYSAIVFEELGFATQLLSYGMKGHSLDQTLEFKNYYKVDDYFENIINLQNITDSILSGFDSEEKVIELYELEKAILPIVVEMETNGIILDISKVREYKERLTNLRLEIQKEIFAISKEEFNINSPKQVGEVLFDKLGIKSNKKTKSGAKSTSERALLDIIDESPIVQKILDYREVDKLINTYFEPLPTYVAKDNRIHATFDQMGAVSGRFSSKNPNLQNIPVNESLNVNTRECFIAGEGKMFITFDYSQQELRILAALAKEEKMLNSFNNNQDIHKLTASKIFNVPLEEVDKNQREVGKTINFSIVYGISAFGLADRMKIERKAAADFIDAYYETYPNIYSFFENLKKTAQEQGYTETILGRKRRNPQINSKQFFLRSAAERELLNFVIQGSAADLMKLAMRKINQYDNKVSAKLLIQIHDEFLFEVKGKDVNEGQVRQFVKDIKGIMEGVYEIGVKYKVDVKYGKNWGKMQEINN